MASRANRPQFRWLPASTQGKWAVALGVLAILFSVPGSPLIGFPSVVVITAAAALAIDAMLRRHDRSLFFLLPLLLAALIGVFLIGELVAPH
jgi:hypothetical protein